jgi:hypothetical protein
MNQEVTDYIDKLTQAWQADLCNQIREVIHQSIPEVQERIQYGKPHFLKNGKYACVLGPAKGWVSLTIFNAQVVNMPENLFEASKNGDRKTIKIREGQEVDYEALATYLQQAASDL